MNKGSRVAMVVLLISTLFSSSVCDLYYKLLKNCVHVFFFYFRITWLICQIALYFDFLMLQFILLLLLLYIEKDVLPY